MQLMEGRRGHLIAGIILVLVPLIFFWEMVVQGQEPLAPDTQAVRPFTLWATEASEQLGEMPLWCPGVFAGMPSYGSFIYTPPGALDPLQALRSLLGRTRGLRYFLGYLIGGLSMYGILRLRRLSALPALTVRHCGSPCCGIWFLTKLVARMGSIPDTYVTRHAIDANTGGVIRSFGKASNLCLTAADAA